MNAKKNDFLRKTKQIQNQGSVKRVSVLLIAFLIFTMHTAGEIRALTWVIDQEGAGDFTTISAGITVAEDGDTLLVHPGLYYERINYQGKDITITSLYDGNTFDDSYIADTVIDGNHEGTVVVFNSGETRNAVLNGFTIRHGKGEYYHSPGYTMGGGIFIRYSSPIIKNCIIEHNYACNGGGLNVYQSGNPLLAGNKIRFNHARTVGGGICTSGQLESTDIEFSGNSLNSIYLNYGVYGTDLFFGGIAQSPVVLDTFTVQHPDRYFIRTNRLFNPEVVDITINNSLITPIESDIYVSPEGDDNNSGLSPAEPLRTIALAMIKIAPDSMIQRTVHLAEGIYSSSLNNQLFPVQIRDNVSLIGANRQTTILDGENDFNLLAAHDYYDLSDDPINNFQVRNLTIVNGTNYSDGQVRWTAGAGALYFHYVGDFVVDNIDISNCHTFGIGVFESYHAEGNYKVKNVSINNTSGRGALYLGHTWGEYHFGVENIRIRNHTHGPFDPDFVGGSGIGMQISAHSTYTPDNTSGTLFNIEVTDCEINYVPWLWQNLPYGSLFVLGPGNIRLINATIGNNQTAYANGGGLVATNARLNLEIINSIIYGNTPHNMSLATGLPNPNPSFVSISHSLLGGGEDGILWYGASHFELTWGEGNIDADPLWMGDLNPEYPYALSAGSPAIDAGTLDIPDFDFPAYDLAGNPRIYGDSIDLGAYEYQGFGGTNIDENDEPVQTPSAHDYKLYNYPNPVVQLQGDGRMGGSTGTSISFMLPRDGHVEIDVYNLKGQFVKRLIDAHTTKGEHSVFWDGKNELDRYVATGFYMYELKINGKTAASGRCTFIK